MRFSILDFVRPDNAIFILLSLDLAADLIVWYATALPALPVQPNTDIECGLFPGGVIAVVYAVGGVTILSLYW